MSKPQFPNGDPIVTEQNPAADLMALVNGYQISQAIHVAATLGIADLLREGPWDSDSHAAAIGIPMVRHRAPNVETSKPEEKACLPSMPGFCESPRSMPWWE